jgi:hypothetical protein
MRRVLMNLFLGVTLLPVPAMVGCDKTISDTKSVDQKANGTTVTKEDKVTQDPNTGTVTKTSEKSVDK